MNFSERPPSNDWVPLEHRGEVVAEAWFKPEDELLALVFQIPASRLQVDDLDQLLSVEDLLTVAAVSIQEVESWQFLDESHLSLDGTNLELKRLLPAPPPDETHLTVNVRMKPPASAVAHSESEPQEVPLKKWQELDALWKGILGLEAAIDSLRLSMDGLRSELDNAFRKTMNVEEKVHALQSDVNIWNKAKTRVHHVVPKVREFIHRATWALATPERKRQGEMVENHIEPRIPHPQMHELEEQLGHLQKDRQLLLTQGNAVNLEGRGILSEIQRAMSNLQRNAADRARQKRSAGRDKGKHL